ncbi:MAG: rubredoxin [Thermoplasmata archaeon]|nr:rubredoxin [Thermoplasmata archaeon]
MAKYICTLCKYVYDEDVGIPEKGIAPGTKWSDLPDDWVCPLCGSRKKDFELMGEQASVPTSVKDEKPEPRVVNTGSELDGTVKVPAGYGDDDLRALSYAEAAVLCSNLSKGCEKQYLMEESAAFKKISDYYMSKAGTVEGTFDDLMALIEENLSTNDEALRIGKKSGDRGAYRVTLWNNSVSKILASLLQRFSDEGNAMLENTNIYVCDICGFIYVGDEPPAICPICKVPSVKLLKVRRD